MLGVGVGAEESVQLRVWVLMGADLTLGTVTP